MITILLALIAAELFGIFIFQAIIVLDRMKEFKAKENGDSLIKKKSEPLEFVLG